MPLSIEQQIEALRDLRGSERDPEGRAFAPLADAYRRAGQLKQAMAVLREGLARMPDFATGHVVAARLYLDAGLTAESEVSSRRALDLDPHNSVALEVLADALDARGARGEADEVRQRLAEILEPSDGDRAADGPTSAADDDEGVEAEEGLDTEEGDVVDIAELMPDVATLDDGVAEAAVEDVVDITELMPGTEEGFVDIHDLAPQGPAELAGAIGPVAVEEPVLATPSGTAPEADVADTETVDEIAARFADEPDAGDDEGLPSDEIGEELPVVTRTLAELFVAQGLEERAIAVYRQLIEASPEEESFVHRLRELEGAVAGSLPPATAPVGPDAHGGDDDDDSDHAWHAHLHTELHEVDTPFAWTRQEPEEGPPAPAISDYFERLLSWEPSTPPTGEGQPENGRDREGFGPGWEPA